MRVFRFFFFFSEFSNFVSNTVFLYIVTVPKEVRNEASMSLSQPAITLHLIHPHDLSI